MEQFTYKTTGTCAHLIHFERDAENRIHNISFEGGCNGNLKAIAKLCEGMKAEEINAKLLGNLCGNKPTSCADQLAKAVMTQIA
ncbi:MAG: TIGR03905 family TSCPD domain-containing protein [Treponema sp.]|nr:TIGR03905 family TSCPD domain-containing protein [Treponema sp.]